MAKPGKIQKLDEVVVNRIAAGEVIQRPANALKELIENSLDAKATNIQITVKDGGLKSLQIQDNGTGIRKEDMAIVCERFTTSKLKKFEDLRSIATFGFRGEALASMSHVAHLTITTKTIDDKVAHKASYVDGKMKAAPRSLAGNQGTTILIENLFYNVATRKRALSSPAEEFSRISEVVTKYAIHNPTVGFTLKKQGETLCAVRTPHNSTKSGNIKLLFGNTVARELLDIELNDTSLKFQMHCLMTSPNYSNKRLNLILFINHRLVDSNPIKRMLEDLYSIYLPRKTHPWCYLSLEINPANVDVNVHPTKHEVRFLHEDAIVEKMRITLDEHLAKSNNSRTFYVQARLPQVDITKEALQKVLPECDKDKEKKKVYAKEMIRTDANDQKLDKFNFTVQRKEGNDGVSVEIMDESGVNDEKETENEEMKQNEQMETEKEDTLISCALSTPRKELIVDYDPMSAKSPETPENPPNSSPIAHWSSLLDQITSDSSQTSTNPPKNSQEMVKKVSEKEDYQSIPQEVLELFSSEGESSNDAAESLDINSSIADRALRTVFQRFGSQKSEEKITPESDLNGESTCEDKDKTLTPEKKAEELLASTSGENEEKSEKTPKKPVPEFKSYSVNNSRRDVKLTSVLKLRKAVEDNYHEGLRKIIAELTFVGCVDEEFALIQSDVNLYICNTAKLAEELFYEIMLYDFANFGVFKFSEPLPIYDLAMLGLETEEAGWSEEDGAKEEIAETVKELLMDKSEMLKEYFSIAIDKRGNLRSLPVLLENYFPNQAEIPIFILRLSTEVDWSNEQPCFDGVCRETARLYAKSDPDDLQRDWKHITEHVIYAAIKESLLPPNHFAHDSSILQIASLPNLYKVFERC